MPLLHIKKSSRNLNPAGKENHVKKQRMNDMITVCTAVSLLLASGTLPALAATVTAGTSAAGVQTQAYPSVQETGTGWKKQGINWIYYASEGMPQQGGFTPDGYLLDANGIWRQSGRVILGETISYPDRFVPADQMKNWENLQPDLERIAKQIQKALGNIRLIELDEESISYFRVSSGNTLLLRFSQNTGTNGYQMRISTNLGNLKNAESKASTYDYALFYLLLAKVSHTPDALADAIYGSWQGNNPYNLVENQEIQVGDAFLSFRIENGAGIYQIRNAWKP